MWAHRERSAGLSSALSQRARPLRFFRSARRFGNRPIGYTHKIIMRTLWGVLLVVVVGLFAGSEAVAAGRHLRQDVTGRTGTDDEERAVAKFTGSFVDKADMDKWLMTWLNKKKSVEDVSKKLGVFGKQQDAAKLNPNWEALLKFSAMKKVRKEESAYARFGTGLQSKFKTDENLMRWALNGDSVKSVAQTLGVSGLPRAQLISHENYYAFKTFLRWRKEYAQMVATNFQSMT